MAFSLLWLPGVLLRAGLKVAEVDGWRERGRGDVGPTVGVICHHTGAGRRGNMPALQALIHGRSDRLDPSKNLPGPLAQLGLGRDGTYYVIAAGRANHAGLGIWNGHTSGNGTFIGIEGENTGRPDDPWPDVQLDAYRRGVAALLLHLRLPVSACAGHKEWALPAGRKPDPSFDMHAFRAGVAAIMAGTASPPVVIPPIEVVTQPGVSPRLTLRRGMVHPLVSELQRKLGLAASGVFDASAEAALRAFQRHHGLVPDGIAGPKTWRKLDLATDGAHEARASA